MKTGDIIRRVDSAGNFIGKYYIVYKISGNLLYIRDKLLVLNKFDPRAKYVIVNKKFYKSLTVKTLKIKAIQLTALKSGISKIISHDFCKSWENIYTELPDVIKFITVDDDRILYAIPEHSCRFVKKTVINQNKFSDLTQLDRMIRIKIKHTIL